MTRPAPSLVLVPLLIGIAVLAACAADPPGDGLVAGPPGSVPPTGVVSSGTLPPPPPGAGAPEPTPAYVTPQPVRDARPYRWTRASPSGDGREVVVAGTLPGGPPCVVVGRIDVTETASRVTITVLAGPAAGANCDEPQPQLGFPYLTRVRLREPVGTRELRDGAA